MGVQPGAFDEAVQGVDAVIHAASPVSFSTEDPEGSFDLEVLRRSFRLMFE